MWQRSVTRRELDGSITVIANSFQGRRLNQPNDVIVKSDASIYFTRGHSRLRWSDGTSPIWASTGSRPLSAHHLTSLRNKPTEL